MRVVVVGATGNVGTSVIHSLVADPSIESIVAVARRRSPNRTAKVTWVEADIGVDPLEPVVRHADAVVHLAWMIQPQRDHALLARTNVVGTMRLLGAAARERVPAFVYASSVGTYGPGPKDRRVHESWPATGIASSVYSRQKATVEALLDEYERTSRNMRIVRMRTSLVFQRSAASEIGRIFFGPAVPRWLLRPGRLPLVPAVRGLRFQATHASDIAAAYHAAVVRDVSGAFNIASDPVIDPDLLAASLDARQLPLPSWMLRGAVALGWHARAVPIEPGMDRHGDGDAAHGFVTGALRARVGTDRGVDRCVARAVRRTRRPSGRTDSAAASSTLRTAGGNGQGRISTLTVPSCFAWKSA